MAKSGNLVYQRSFSPIINPCPTASKGKTFRFLSQFHTYNNSNVSVTITASTKRIVNSQSPLIGKNTSRSARPLIKISPSAGKYHGEWTSDYLVSLRDLHLQDLIKGEDDPRKNAKILINLSIQKHASFGLSVDARITAPFPSYCINCSSPYCRQLDVNLNVWVLKAARRDKPKRPNFNELIFKVGRRDKRKRSNFDEWVLKASRRDERKTSLPEIGGDPDVIYTRPGCQVVLDSFVRDAIRLNLAVKGTCSELCASELRRKPEDTVLYATPHSDASFDKRWSKLLELKKTML